MKFLKQKVVFRLTLIPIQPLTYTNICATNYNKKHFFLEKNKSMSWRGPPITRKTTQVSLSAPIWITQETQNGFVASF